MKRPEYLSRGEEARLFPVLATTSKEGRATSIFLACLARVDEFGAELLGHLGQRIGVRSTINCFTEIVFKGEKDTSKDRPDGLIIVTTGTRQWRALVEAKVGQNLDSDQIEKYRGIAKDQKIDCVISISNEFATIPSVHPLEAVRKSRSRVDVFHWSWRSILTSADLLLTNDGVQDNDQRYLLQELKRFLTHQSTGITGFDRMPAEWTELNRLVSAGGKIGARSPEASAVVAAWHQECRDLSLVLTLQTGTNVTERMSRKYLNNAELRTKDEIEHLRSESQLKAELDIPDAAAPLSIVADLPRRTIDVGMTLKAPEERKSSKARLNWLLKQVRGEVPADLQIRCNWPGRSETTQFAFEALRDKPYLIDEGKQGMQVTSFHIFLSRRLGGRFTQQANFIVDLEATVPEFYRLIGQDLKAWKASAPRIKPDRLTAKEVGIEALADQQEENK